MGNFGYILAHNWDILNGERIRRWPSKSDSRVIRINITTWKNIDLGAKHYDVDIEEEPNQWWCEEKNAWVELSCDSYKQGYSFKAKVMSKEQADNFVEFCIKFIQDNNPDQKYKKMVGYDDEEDV